MKRGKMDKIRVSLKVNDYTIKENGIKEENIITVMTKEENMQYDLKNNILTRENNDMKQIINFPKEVFNYCLKEISTEFSEKIKLISLTNKDKQVNIIYQIGRDNFNLDLKYETIE